MEELGGALDDCLWFLLPDEFFADLIVYKISLLLTYNS